MTIDEQAREYARKAIAPHSVYEVKRLAEVERGFITGASRTPSDAELEEAAKAMRAAQEASFGWRHDDWDQLDEEVHQHFYRMVKAVCRSLGMTVQ